MSYKLEDFGEHICAARKQKRRSQRELNDIAGVPQFHISKIENGSVDLRFSSMMAIARALELEPILIPRKALPAVNAITRSVTQADALNSAVRIS